jgi:hypothetical protein
MAHMFSDRLSSVFFQSSHAVCIIHLSWDVVRDLCHNQNFYLYLYLLITGISSKYWSVALTIQICMKHSDSLLQWFLIVALKYTNRNIQEN